jgi:rod shape-determining protein MreC
MVTLILALIIASLIWGSTGSVLNDAMHSLLAPVDEVVGRWTGELKGLYAYMHDFDKLKAENERLKSAVASMEGDIRAARNALVENEKLLQLLELTASSDGYLPITVEPVISWNPSAWTSAFTIGGGENAGIRVGDTVITADGFLVGQVIEVGGSTSTVRTLVDVDSSVGAIVDRSGLTGIAAGEFQLMERGVLKLGFLQAGSNPPLNGDTIMTSGAGEVFPQGLVIGKISAYKIDNSGMDWYGEITPSAELETLTSVVVVR